MKTIIIGNDLINLDEVVTIKKIEPIDYDDSITFEIMFKNGKIIIILAKGVMLSEIQAIMSKE